MSCDRCLSNGLICGCVHETAWMLYYESDIVTECVWFEEDDYAQDIPESQ